MKIDDRRLPGFARAGVVLAVFAVGSTTVYSQRVVGSPVVARAVSGPSESDPGVVQQELIKLVKLSPTLTGVVERDPSLLADQAYVARVNPELEQFLMTHPEVTRNPDFYLFSELQQGRHRGEVLQRKGWPNEGREVQEDPAVEVLRQVVPLLAFGCGLAAVLWLVHVLLQNKRWSRASRLQMEAHGTLMERFGNNQELLAYMNSEAGRRYLEAAPIPMDLEAEQRLPNAVSRVLLSLQIGLVLALLGWGLLFLRRALPDMNVLLLVTGTVFLMPGIGFLVSAAATWVLGARLGLMPVVDTGSRQ